MNYLMEKVELPLIPVVVQLEANGYMIDCDYFNALKARLEPEQASVLLDIQAIAGGNLNPNSSNQVAKLLYEELGFPVSKKTKKGTSSTDEESLNLLLGSHPVVEKILEYKKIGKIISTYCNFPNEVDDDSRLRSEYSQLGTVTGRFTATKKIQTLPKNDRYGIRDGFIASPGFKIVGADFDQQELYILASVSKDAVMLDAIARGVDLHGLAAKKVFSLDCEPSEVKHKYPEKRGQVKAVQFGILYGSGAQSLAQKLSMSLESAEGLIEDYFKIFPQVKSFIERNHDFTVKHGWNVDVFGRRGFFPDAQLKTKSKLSSREAALRQAQNFPIQAAGATITKLAMIRCYNHIQEFHPQIKMVLSMHDELQFEVPDEEVDHFAAELPVLMTDLEIESFGFNIPFQVTVNSGKSWGALTAHQSVYFGAPK